jgi:hypothetical protein
MVVPIKNAVFWDGVPCGSCQNRRFGGPRLHLQGGKDQRTRNSVRSLLVTANAFPSSLFTLHPEDGGDTFPRNVGSSKTHTAPHPRRRVSPWLHVCFKMDKNCKAMGESISKRVNTYVFCPPPQPHRWQDPEKPQGDKFRK